MRKLNFIITEELQNMRIDKAISSLSSEFSRSKIQKFIKSGNVILNKNQINDISCLVKFEDEIEMNVIEEDYVSLKPSSVPLDIIYEDEDLYVINKQYGMTVHPGAGNQDNTLVNALLGYKNELSDVGGAERPGIVHRLDKDTSGLIIVAKNNFAHNNISEQIKERLVKRYYKALVWGMLKPVKGVVEMNITRDARDRTKMTTVSTGGKEAVTHYQTLKLYAHSLCSLVECRLETGRTHQIRVHMSHSRHSIVGDQVYGNNSRKVFGSPEPYKAILTTMKRQALHAYYIAFKHPRSDKEMEFEIPLAEDFATILDQLEKSFVAK